MKTIDPVLKLKSMLQLPAPLTGIRIKNKLLSADSNKILYGGSNSTVLNEFETRYHDLIFEKLKKIVMGSPSPVTTQVPTASIMGILSAKIGFSPEVYLNDLHWFITYKNLEFDLFVSEFLKVEVRTAFNLNEHVDKVAILEEFLQRLMP